MDASRKFPDVIFIGPLKTATSYIYDYYLHHPSVATSEPIKELFYYDDYYNKGGDWYLSHFSPQANHQVTIDVSPSYMIRDITIARIKKDNPNVKIVMTLRDPMERFSSHVKHHIRHGYAFKGFSDLLEEHPRVVRGSQYEKYVDQWVSAFGESNVFVLDYRQLKEDPKAFMAKTCEILGVSFNEHYQFEQKVNSEAVGSVRSPLLMRLIQLVKRTLIQTGLSGVIEAVKRTGLKNLVFKKGEAFTISAQDKEEARRYLAQSTAWYNERFQVNDNSVYKS